MRLLYIHPEPGGEDRVGEPEGARPASYPVLPVGAVAHINALRAAGHSPEGLNLPVERMVDPGFTLDGWLNRNEPVGLALLDLHWYEHAAGAVDAAARIRRAWPATRIVVGGLTATRFATELLELCPAIDAVVVGDAEGPIQALVASIADGGDWPPSSIANLQLRDDDGRPFRTALRYQTPAASIDGLDSVALDWLHHAAAYRSLMHSRPARLRGEWSGQWLMSGRGCAFTCAYCGGGRAAHKALSGLSGVVKRSPLALAGDISRLQAAGVSQVALTLDPDMLGKAHQCAFFELLSGRPGFYIESFQLPSLSLLDSLALRTDPAHTEIAITPISGSERVRRAQGKHYSNAALLDVVSAIAARDLSLFLFFSPNLPGEDNETFGDTLALAEQILHRSHPNRLRMIAICHTLDPQSPMLERPGDFGISEIRLRSLADYIAYGRGPRPWTFVDGERGFVVTGPGHPPRDLRDMVRRWDALSLQWPDRVYAVPRV